MKTLPPVEPHLSEEEAEAAFGALLDGETLDEEIARFLVELSDRGETAAEPFSGGIVTHVYSASFRHRIESCFQAARSRRSRRITSDASCR